MLSVENTKNLEDLFKIKSAIMSKKLKEVGGMSGVMEILNLSLDARRHKDYQKSLKIIDPLMDVLKDQPFVSNEAVSYVSISDRMEKILYHHYSPKPSNRQMKNVCEVCPMDLIFRQYTLALLDLGDYPKAMKTVTEAVKWNPASAKSRAMLAILCGVAGRWDDSLKETVAAMKYAYLSVDLVHCFRSLRDYFMYNGLYKEAVYCSFLRARFSSSTDVLKDVAEDMMFFIKKIDFDYKSVSDEDMAAACKKYGFTPGFDPEVIAVVKRCYEEAFIDGKSEKADYFAEIMSDLKTEQEKRNSVSLRQLVERSRNIVS